MPFSLTAFFRCAALAIAAAMAAAPVAAQQGFAALLGPAIAAVVNDQIISTYDLDARLRLGLFSANLPATPENQQRLLPQALRQLVDERLQMQEAQRLNVTVSDDEMAEAIATVEAQNGVPPGGLEGHISGAGVPYGTLLAQIRTSVAWGKVIRRQIRPQIEVGEEEIDDFLRDLRARGGRTEYDVSEILLSAEAFDSIQAARQTADRLAEQARLGTPFGALAQQFSQSPSAAAGGALGRVQEGQLDPRLEAALEQMQPGQVSQAIPVENGFYILRLNDRQRVEGGRGEEMLALGRIFLPITPGMPETALVALEESAARVSDQATNCPDMQRLGREAGSRADPEPAIVRPDDLPPGLLEIIAPLPANRATPPIRLEDGFLVAMVCERRSGSDAGLPSRDEVMQSLGMQRIDMMARRYLRDLRRAAFVDVRL